jgi:energy-coupling factor transporter ATP-binding protein EcfA2
MGISMIHQELSPEPYMTVAENIFLGREPLGRFGLIDKKKMIADTRALLERLEINIDPNTVMRNLSVANTQMVEIAKAISYDSSLIIMDEPTSAITEREVAHLFRIIRTLKEKGVAIIYITHKMDEVFQIADDITVFRDGRHIATVPADGDRPQQPDRHDGGPRTDQPFPQGGRAHRRGHACGAQPDAQRHCRGCQLRPAAGRNFGAGRADGRRAHRSDRGALWHQAARRRRDHDQGRTGAHQVSAATPSGMAWRCSPRTASSPASWACCPCATT